MELVDKELLKVLEARERRWKTRKLLVEKRGACVITITLCLPIPFRIEEEFWTLFYKLCRAFYRNLVSKGHPVRFEGCIRSHDGPVFFISAKTKAMEIKKLCVEAEEVLPGGRILDIDVMDTDGTTVDRSDLMLPPRKCFICENPASICVSRRIHSINEITKFVKNTKKQIIEVCRIYGKFIVNTLYR